MPTDPLPERPEREPKAKSAPRPPLLFVVSRHALDCYQSLKQIFADDERVTVIFDRRLGERRKTPSARDPGRRPADRRSRPLIDDRLRQQDWAMVRLEPSMWPPAPKERVERR